MFEALSVISAEDGISKSNLLRGLVAQQMMSRIERRMILGLARKPRAVYPSANITNRRYNRRR